MKVYILKIKDVKNNEDITLIYPTKLEFNLAKKFVEDFDKNWKQDDFEPEGLYYTDELLDSLEDNGLEGMNYQTQDIVVNE